VAVCLQIGAAENVPVFLWSTEGNVVFPEALAGHSISGEEFASGYLKQALSNSQDRERLAGNVALFLQDEIGLTKMAREANVFNGSRVALSNLEKAMTNFKSAFLPSVSSAVAALTAMFAGSEAAYIDGESTGFLPSDKLAVHELKAPYTNLADYEDEDTTGSSNLFLVRLPAQATFGEIDGIIGKVTSLLKSLDKAFTAVYTAEYSSSEPQYGAGLSDDSANHVGSGRSLLRINYEEDVSYTFANLSNCVYFYAQNISLSVYGYPDSWYLPSDPAIDDSSSCANDTAQLTLKYQNVDEYLQEVNLTMGFGVTQGNNAGYWYMTNFSVSFAIYNSSSEVHDNQLVYLFPYFVTETPYGFSYSCSDLPPISTHTTLYGKGSGSANITFNGLLQIQAFEINGYEFGYYNDCVGFFSIMTWACLFVLFIMSGILLFAACMFAGLSTPDRYDNVHAKTITVNEVE
jgi:V-type H+-transporting ATPase S1 subunit